MKGHIVVSYDYACARAESSRLRVPLTALRFQALSYYASGVRGP